MFVVWSLMATLSIILMNLSIAASKLLSLCSIVLVVIGPSVVGMSAVSCCFSSLLTNVSNLFSTMLNLVTNSIDASLLAALAALSELLYVHCKS